MKYTREWGTKGGTYLVNAMGTALSWTLNIGLGLIFAIYMLLDKERLMMQGKRILRAYASDEWLTVLVMLHVLLFKRSVTSL